MELARDSNRVTLAVLMMACALAGIVGLASEATAAKGGGGPGALDRSFGTAGKAMVPFRAENAGDVGVKYSLPFQFTAGHLRMAIAPGGKIVVASSTKIVRFLPNGKLDPSFGSGGSVAVERPAGMTFLLAAVAVDSQGRVLIAGSSRPQPTNSTPDPLSSLAAVMRFGSDGSVDRSFGSEGATISSLGIEPPAIGSTRYTAAAVGLNSLVVDSQDRAILAGGSVSEVALCHGTETALSAGFVARLTSAGTLDPSFGDQGLRQIADLSSFADASLPATGTLFTVGSGKSVCEGRRGPTVVLTRFGNEGNLDPGFGFAGFRAIGLQRAPTATVASSGKIVLLGARRGKAQLVMRLLPNGTFDPGFGRIGRISVILPRGAVLKAVAVDRRNRLLLAGRASRRVSKKNPVRRSTFLLGRLDPKGRFDRSFGLHGSVRTGFGGPSSATASQILLDARGRIVAGGTVSTPKLATGGGFALARYFNR